MPVFLNGTLDDFPSTVLIPKSISSNVTRARSKDTVQKRLVTVGPGRKRLESQESEDSWRRAEFEQILHGAAWSSSKWSGTP